MNIAFIAHKAYVSQLSFYNFVGVIDWYVGTIIHIQGYNLTKMEESAPTSDYTTQTVFNVSEIVEQKSDKSQLEQEKT